MALANTMPYTNDAKTRVSTLVFSRPKQRNAAHPSTMIDWLLGVRRAAEDPNCSILVLTGLDDALSPLDANKPGRNFYCSGIETNLATDPSKVTDEDLKLGLAVWRELIASLISFPKLLVCAVNGNAIGFGFTTMGLADFVFARQGVGLLAPFTRVGVPPGACSTAIFPKIFGERLANEVLIEGRRVTAKEAEGKFVNKTFPDSTPNLLAALQPWLASMSSIPLATLVSTKALLRPDKWRQEMLELNAKECQALEDTLLGSGGKRGPVNFVRYFGELGILWRQSQQGSSPSQSKL